MKTEEPLRILTYKHQKFSFLQETYKSLHIHRLRQRTSTSSFVCHFCITQDVYQSICLPLLHHRGFQPVHLANNSASQRMSIILLARHFCITQDVYSPFVCHFCIKQDVYQTICLPLLYHTRSLSVHMTSTSVSHSMSTCSSYFPHLYLTGDLPVYFTNTSIYQSMSTCPFYPHICISQDAYLFF